MADPITLQVLSAVKTRLETINTANGFNTDPSIYLGVRRVNDNQLTSGPVISVFDIEDEPDDTTAWGDEPVHTTLSIVVEGIVDDSNQQGLPLAHYLFQDIFNAALDVDDRTLGGLVLDFGYAGRTMEYPDTGGTRIGVSVTFTALIVQTYGSI